jgi:hypothetical protein
MKRRFILAASLVVLAAAFGLPGGSVGPPPALAAGTHGTNSCIGPDACTNNSGTIGNNSCNGTSACEDNQTTVGDNSCDGHFACPDVGGPIDHDSCNFTEACEGLSGSVGHDSCDGEFSCKDADFSIPDGSCNSGAGGQDACHSAGGTVGTGSCNGSQACYEAGDAGGFSTIGESSCDGVYACADNGAAPLDAPDTGLGIVGSNSCNALDACDFNGSGSPKYGIVLDGSCNAEKACEQNGYYGVGSVGSSSCDGHLACLDNGYGYGANGIVGDHSCNGEDTCTGTGYEGQGQIGTYSCNGEGICDISQLPNVHGLTIGNYSCNGFAALGNPCQSDFAPIGDCQWNSVVDVALDAIIAAACDTTPPTAAPTQSPPANANGWNNTDVTVTWNWSDSESGVDPSNCTNESTSSGEGTLVLTASCKDKAGNQGSAQYKVEVDKTPPSVTVKGVANGATYQLGSVPTAGCSTTDALSGVAAQATPNSSGGPVGAVTATCSGASDKAGNVTPPVSVTYNVTYVWTGFFKPVDNPPTANSGNAGAAVAVKFSLAGNQGTSIFAAGSPSSTPVACAAPGSTTGPTTPTTGNLTYDTTGGQYVYVWKTDKAWANQCRQLTVTLADGTEHSALLAFK